MKATIGIDPGKGGAIAVIIDGLPPHAETFENGIAFAVGRAMNIVGPDCDTQAVIEAVHAFPGQGVSSCFAFGQAYGEAIGALDALEIPYRKISPQAWQKTLPPMPKKKDGAAAHKRALLLEAKRRFPACRLTLKTCDAVLIAECGHLKRTES